ncbi:MAG: sulfotransferase [Cyanobacteria bacterium P01_F01_bin.53]
MIQARAGDFNADALLKKATQKSGLQDYGDSAFEMPFRLLVQALNEEAQLSVKGRLMVRADLLRLLANRLRIIRDRQTLPTISQQTIEHPIFILGFPRTGSSFLHNLLAQDPLLQVPHYWETLYPSPPPKSGLEDRSNNQRIDKTNRDFRWFNRLNPKYKKIYQYGAQEAAECIALLATSFESLRFAFTYRVPTYLKWAQNNPLSHGYHFHKEFLQHLQAQRPSARWVLKAPAHLLHLETLLTVYPDATVIFTHRHPFRTIASITSNTFTLRQAFSNHSNPQEVAQEELSRWRLGWERSHNIRQQWPSTQPLYLDLMYEDLRQHPMTVVEAIYQHCQMPLEDATRVKMEQFIAAHPKDAHGKHHYNLEQFGLSQALIQQAFASYLETFDFRETGP